MSNQYEGEWQRLSQIAGDVNRLESRIRELEDHASRIREQIANLPYETDEDGNDIYEGTRDALYSQLSSVEGLIREAEYQQRELASYAESLAGSYDQQAADYTYKASKASGAASDFQKLSGYRFGASTASAGANLASQRSTHYEDHANILNSLAAAARRAANGIAPSGISTSVSDRGTFQNPGSVLGAGSAVNRQANNAFTNAVGTAQKQLWSGAEGNSVKKAQDEIVAATVSRLGSTGIGYQNGTPNFAPVSHARVNTAVPVAAATGLSVAAGAGSIALADAMLAKKLGISGEEAAQYRKDNGLEWRENGPDGQMDLIPGGIGAEYTEGRQPVKEPTPMDALTAYMCAHNYGMDDYAIYSQDPEWKKLHKAVFPEYHHQTAHGKDLVATFMYDSRSGEAPGQQIAKLQGFLGKPEIVKRTEFERSVKESGIVGFRTFSEGLDVSSQEMRASSYFADVLKNGANFRLNGNGAQAYGEGIYVAINRDHIPGKIPGREDEEAARTDSRNYGRGNNPTTLTMTMCGDVKIADFDNVLREFKQLDIQDQSRFGGSGRDGVGAYAIAKGLDALVHKDWDCDYLIVYNRTKLVVLEEDNEKD